jgi:hypothetical protein
MSAQRPVRRLVGFLAVCFSVVALLVALPATVAPAPQAQAANAADWNPGNIIDDAVFYDADAMDAAAVQSFLNQRVQNCAAGFTCLKDYRQNTDNRPADQYCAGYTGRAGESAAQIINNVARSCGISQQVILVLLEKEQSLVTHTSPGPTRYLKATGQGCPDTAPCDSATAGFFYQVYYAARQYEIYRLNPTWWGYQAGRWNNILYHPTNPCGTQRVYIENQATAGLYIYTPYVPNASALNNMYGTGDSCASYGNRNFWRIFTDWFGSTRANHNPDSPFGNVELVESRPGEFRVVGWAGDPNTADPISVHIYVGSAGTPVAADLERTDVGAAYPKLGVRHGFDAMIPATGGGQVDVCVYAINSGPGATTVLGCWSRSSMSGPPTGSFEAAKVEDRSIVVAGWAIDPDTVDPIAVHVYIDGQGTPILADKERTDLKPLYPAYGGAHGFSARLSAEPGPHNVCAYAINKGAGGHVELGCRQVVVPGDVDGGRVPIGNFEALTVDGRTAVAAGWALDPDTASPIAVHLYMGGVGSAYTANRSRPDVAAAYPGYGAGHGFVETLTLPAGRSEVCAYAINNGRGGHVQLGCKVVTVSDIKDGGRAPIGSLEAVKVSGSTATVVGWTLDPDTTAPISVHIYVGPSGRAYTANKDRSDVAAAYPAYGAAHGFTESVTLPTGTSDVCAYGINNAAGGHTLLGCKTVTMASRPDPGRVPFGAVESVTATPGAVTAVGWVLDPDTQAPIAVHVYVDALGTAHTAGDVRTDVGAAYPASGPNHGYNVTVPATRGAHNVCVYGINDGTGGNVLLACRSVSVP